MMKHRVNISKPETIERFCGALSRRIDPHVRRVMACELADTYALHTRMLCTVYTQVWSAHSAPHKFVIVGSLSGTLDPSRTP